MTEKVKTMDSHFRIPAAAEIWCGNRGGEFEIVGPAYGGSNSIYIVYREKIPNAPLRVEPLSLFTKLWHPQWQKSETS